jgi:hypothetical protein
VAIVSPGSPEYVFSMYNCCETAGFWV